MPACCSACATAGGSRAILSWAATASAHHNHAAVSNRSARISERHHRVCGGHRYVPAELCAHRIAEDLRGIGFAVYYESLARRALKVAQPRQQPGMVDMGVREQHEIKRTRIEGEMAVVLFARFAAALE